MYQNNNLQLYNSHVWNSIRNKSIQLTWLVTINAQSNVDRHYYELWYNDILLIVKYSNIWAITRVKYILDISIFTICSLYPQYRNNKSLLCTNNATHSKRSTTKWNVHPRNTKISFSENTSEWNKCMKSFHTTIIVLHLRKHYNSLWPVWCTSVSFISLE